MKNTWLRRAGATVVAIVCGTLFVTQTFAGSVFLPQPVAQKTTFNVTSVWRSGGMTFEPLVPAAAGEPAPVPPVHEPAPNPPVKLPVPKLPVHPQVPPPSAEVSVPELPVQPLLPAPADALPVTRIRESVRKAAPIQEVRPVAPPVNPGAPAVTNPAALPAAQAAQNIRKQLKGSSFELIVKTRSGENIQVLAQAEAGLDVTVIEEIPQLNIQVVRVTAPNTTMALQSVRRLSGIVYAEPNYKVRLLELPDDPDVASQWHLQALEVPAAWEWATGTGVTIAVVDTGVDPEEPDLKNKLVQGYDFVNRDPAAWDDQGHGTRIALVAAAQANNEYGGAGIAYDARIMPLKAVDSTGTGSHAWIAKAIIWATDHGADIINLSIGGPYPSRTLEEAITYAAERGVLLVAAAGNEGSNVPVYPAAYETVLAVAGTTPNRQRASFSNWGDYVDVSAPGTNILVTQSGSHRLNHGTSLATPQVTGVAALVQSRNPELTGDQVRDILENSALDLGEPGWDPYFGFGQVNAYQAVSQAFGDDRETPSPTTAVIDAINRMRHMRGLPALHPDAALIAAAQQKAEKLVSRCALHNQQPVETCLTQAGRTNPRQQEVLLFGVSSPQAVVDLLAVSPEGQRLLFGSFWQIGAGYVDHQRGAPHQIWILRFAIEPLQPSLGHPIPVPGGLQR